jgi:hypothetical protein
VPLTPYLAGQVVAPEQLKIMVEAFVAACKELGLVDRSDPLVAVVARPIIELASAGERDPIRLKNLAVAKIKM